MSADEAVLYQVVAARRMQQDTLLWQVPALSLSAQAFLFTIALGAGSSDLARILSAGLSAVMTVLSILLMAKHRAIQDHDSKWLERYENAHCLPAVHSREYFRAARRQRWLPPSLYRVWLAGLGLFGVAAVAVVVVTLIAPESLA